MLTGPMELLHVVDITGMKFPVPVTGSAMISCLPHVVGSPMQCEVGSAAEHLGAFWTGVALMCPEMLCQKGSVREGVATEGTLVTTVSLPMNPCFMSLQGLLAAEPSPTQLTQNVALGEMRLDLVQGCQMARQVCSTWQLHQAQVACDWSILVAGIDMFDIFSPQEEDMQTPFAFVPHFFTFHSFHLRAFVVQNGFF